MSPVWPSFWAHIPETDRPAVRDVLTEFLSTGVLFGESGRERELFLVARTYQRELEEYFAPLNIELTLDPDRPILQARPVPGECGLTARFSKDETLLVLTLWRQYDEKRMAAPVEAVIVTANEVDAALRLYFERIEPPTESHLERMLVTLRQRRFIRFQKSDEGFGESRIEILPTLARAIPFEDAKEWTVAVQQFNETQPETPEQR
jgi:hypothetical protein